MMTRIESNQIRLISSELGDLITPDHFLRKLAAAIDFSFIYEIVAPLYSSNGRPSVDPVMLIKMLLIGYLYGIDSERKLEEEIRYNIVYRWFLGLGLTERTPDHSTLSQNRRRGFRGKEVFQQIFEAVVEKCMEAGLVKGKNVVMDSTHLKANADNHRTEWVQVSKSADQYWLDLMDEYLGEKDLDPDYSFVTTVKAKNPHDPDAGYMHRSGKPKGFHYLDHQCSDADTGIILDVSVTPGNVQDCTCCVERYAYLKREKHYPITNAGLDSGYDTITVHHGLTALGIKGYISECARGSGPHVKDDMFALRAFRFDAARDRYVCPNRCFLTFRTTTHHRGTPVTRYSARTQDCNNCDLRSRCFKGKVHLRSIDRHIHQEDRDLGLLRIGTLPFKAIMRKRSVICEGNFALQKRCHNLRFTRKRGLANVLEQCLLSAMALNLKRLVKYGKGSLLVAASAAMDFLRWLFWSVSVPKLSSACLNA